MQIQVVEVLQQTYQEFVVDCTDIRAGWSLGPVHSRYIWMEVVGISFTTFNFVLASVVLFVMVKPYTCNSIVCTKRIQPQTMSWSSVNSNAMNMMMLLDDEAQIVAPVEDRDICILHYLWQLVSLSAVWAKDMVDWLATNIGRMWTITRKWLYTTWITHHILQANNEPSKVRSQLAQ